MAANYPANLALAELLLQAAAVVAAVTTARLVMVRFTHPAVVAVSACMVKARMERVVLAGTHPVLAVAAEAEAAARPVKRLPTKIPLEELAALTAAAEAPGNHDFVVGLGLRRRTPEETVLSVLFVSFGLAALAAPRRSRLPMLEPDR